ncbi:arginase-like protein [Xylaria sp. CBS 124048]|nr:arginase-like protein [Xylaria sp. CBS 124048]
MNSVVRSKFLARPNDIGVVAVGFSGGQGKAGVDAAPSALIESGLLSQLRDELSYNLHGDDKVNAYNDLVPQNDPPYRNMKNPGAVSAVTQRLAERVYSHAKQGQMVLTLGGDHSIAIGTIAGTAKAIRERLGREIAVIWVDAHADINTPETSGSGNVHGMPVAFLTGLAKESKPEYFGWLKAEHMLNINKLVYIGLRDVDAGEKRLLRENGIKAFSMFDIDRYGIGRVMEMALAHIGNDTPIHLSFDVDALDPMWAPSTGTPVRGGLTLREGDFICESVHMTGSLVAVDLVEVNPSLAADREVEANETIRAGCSIYPRKKHRRRNPFSPPLFHPRMASSTMTGMRTESFVYERRTARIHRYHWPAIQLNIWMIIMLAASFLIIAVFASFIDIQNQILLDVPWYFAYFITVAGLTVGFILLLLWLIAQRRLLPSIVIIGAFVLFVLWLVGLIVIGIELWSPAGGVSSNCNVLVWNNRQKGDNAVTFAWLEQRSICQQWQAVFAFGLIGNVFLLWIIVMAGRVFYGDE